MCSCTCVYKASASAHTHSDLQAKRERERDSVSGLEDREIDTHRGEISQRAKVKRSIMFNLAHPFTCGFEFSVHLCPR